MSKTDKADLDGEALLCINMGGPFEERLYNTDKGVQIRRRTLIAGGASVWIGRGTIRLKDENGKPQGPNTHFWFRIPCATNAEEAFAEYGRHFEAAFPAFVEMVEKKARAAATKIVVPRRTVGMRPGGNGGRPRIHRP